MRRITGLAAAALLLGISAAVPAGQPNGRGYWICVSNELSGDVTIIDGTTNKVVATIPVGKRPRGIHPSPDGKLLYVALSGTPNLGPPKLDEKGNPLFPEEDAKIGDRTADGIGVIDLKEKKFLRKIPTGSDPEQFAVSRDGKRLVVANEDAGTASVPNLEDGKVQAVVKVKKEPEGVGFSPDGKFVWVTCETKGEVVVIDTKTSKAVAEIEVGGRPRGWASCGPPS
jgi:YVTN family beta-propeller protein